MIKVTTVALAAIAASLVSMPVAAEETGLSGIHAQKREGNRICMESHYHYGSSSGQKSRKLAEEAAIRDWAGFTAWEYGTPWGSFKLAASKNLSCTQTSDTWSCQAEARPCKTYRRGK